MAGQTVLSANDSSPVTALGSTHVNFDLVSLLGPRAYVYIRNHDSSDMTAGLAVRQRSDIFTTEGTAVTSDANTTKLNQILDNTLPAPFTTSSYIPNTLERALYWSANDTPTTLSHGKVFENSLVALTLEDVPSTYIGSDVYSIWLPYAFVIAAIDDTMSIGAVAQHTISAGYYGWVQYGGFGYAYILGGDNDDNVGDGLGIIPGSVAGMGNGTTAGTDDGYIYAYSMIDETASETGVYAPVRIAAPYMHRYPILP
jgi:hypothetical protein